MADLPGAVYLRQFSPPKILLHSYSAHGGYTKRHPLTLHCPHHLLLRFLHHCGCPDRPSPPPPLADDIGTLSGHPCLGFYVTATPASYTTPVPLPPCTPPRSLCRCCESLPPAPRPISLHHHPSFVHWPIASLAQPPPHGSHAVSRSSTTQTLGAATPPETDVSQAGTPFLSHHCHGWFGHRLALHPSKARCTGPCTQPSHHITTVEHPFPHFQ